MTPSRVTLLVKEVNLIRCPQCHRVYHWVMLLVKDVSLIRELMPRFKKVSPAES